MVTAAERNNQTRRLIAFLHCLLCIYIIKTSQIKNQNDVKTTCKYKRWISFFLRFMEVWTQWVPCKVNVTPFRCHLLFGRHLLSMWPIAFILPWTSEKWNLFLKWYMLEDSYMYDAHHEKTHTCMMHIRRRLIHLWCTLEDSYLHDAH